MNETAPLRRMLDEQCRCACHQGGSVLHPVPCCSPCRRCGLNIPNGGLSHSCTGNPLHPKTIAVQAVDLSRLLSNHETIFAGSMVLLIMGLAVFSLPQPGYWVLLGAAFLGIGLGLILAFRATRRAQRKPGT